MVIPKVVEKPADLEATVDQSTESVEVLHSEDRYRRERDRC